jgi:hypothetical protein
MKLTSRDRRALFVLSLVIAALACRWAVMGTQSPTSEGLLQHGPDERLLTILANRRKAAATVPQKRQVLRQLVTELESREKRFLQADTAEQAQAQLLQMLKTLMSQQLPPLEIKRIELSSPQLVSQAYGEVSVSVTIECTIDELLNLIADLSDSRQLVATDEISLDTADKNLKTIRARLTTTGLVRHTLIRQPGFSRHDP